MQANSLDIGQMVNGDNKIVTFAHQSPSHNEAQCPINKLELLRLMWIIKITSKEYEQGVSCYAPHT